MRNMGPDRTAWGRDTMQSGVFRELMPPPGAGEPHFEMALEEALFRLVEREGGPPMLRLWFPRSVYVVLGTGRPAARDVKLDLCRREGIPLARRFSGGGTVTHSPGQACFSLFMPAGLHPDLRTVEGSYRFVFRLVSAALGGIGITPCFRPPCDFTMGERKISGNAQRRGRRCVLHHGTLLVDCDVSALGRPLHEPDEAPLYRRGRSHADFLTTLKNEGYNTSVEEIGGAFRRVLCGGPPVEVPEAVLREARRLAGEKYARAEWIFKL